MKLNRIKIFQGDGPVSINSSLSKAVVTGFANTEVVASKYDRCGCLFHSSELNFNIDYCFRVNPIDYSWETLIHLPKLRIEGNYHMQGRILVIPLNGHGKCWFEPSETKLDFNKLRECSKSIYCIRNIFTENMDITMITKTHLYEKGGHVFYNVTSTKIDYTIDGLKLRLDNLFEGVKVLGKKTASNRRTKSFRSHDFLRVIF